MKKKAFASLALALVLCLLAACGVTGDVPEQSGAGGAVPDMPAPDYNSFNREDFLYFLQDSMYTVFINWPVSTEADIQSEEHIWGVCGLLTTYTSKMDGLNGIEIETDANGYQYLQLQRLGAASLEMFGFLYDFTAARQDSVYKSDVPDTLTVLAGFSPGSYEGVVDETSVQYVEGTATVRVDFFTVNPGEEPVAADSKLYTFLYNPLAAICPYQLVTIELVEGNAGGAAEGNTPASVAEGEDPPAGEGE